ncbi:hypothetical protein ACQ4PT_047350 [Festuca glaucescens]
MLSNRTDGDGRRFLNLSTGACARVDLPELSAHHLETSADGLLLLRNKASHAARLLNPLTRVLTDLPPITADLGSAYTLWTGQSPDCTRLVLAGISEETSPPSVVLLMKDRYERAIAYARPCDQRWTVMNSEVWGSLSISFSFSSASTLQGRFYFATPEGNILEASLRPEPRLVPVVASQAKIEFNVNSYLVPPADHHRGGGMLMVRYYTTLNHLSVNERRNMKGRRDVIRLDERTKKYRWSLIQVLEVDVAGKMLLPVEDIGRQQACFSLSARTFPCVAGNAVYLGAEGVRYPPVGVRYLTGKAVDPAFQFTTEDESLLELENSELKGYRVKKPELNLVPLARPCTLQEYLVCCAGLLGGLKD